MTQISYDNIGTATASNMLNSLVDDHGRSIQGGNNIDAVSAAANSDSDSLARLRIHYKSVSSTAGATGYQSGNETQHGYITQQEWTYDTSTFLNADQTTEVTNGSDTVLIKRIITINDTGLTDTTRRQSMLDHVWEQFKTSYAIEFCENSNGLGKFLGNINTEKGQWGTDWGTFSPHFKTYKERYDAVKSDATTESSQSIDNIVDQFIAQATTRTIAAKASGLHGHRDVCKLLSAVSHTGGSNATSIVNDSAGELTQGVYLSLSPDTSSNTYFCSSNGVETSAARQASVTCSGDAAFKGHRVIDNFMTSFESNRTCGMFHNNNNTFVVGLRRLIPRKGISSNNDMTNYLAGTNVMGQSQSIADTNALTRSFADRILAKLQILAL